MKKSAGILLYRTINKEVEVLLAHPGGPYFKNKDEASWSIPKGEFTDEEEPIAAARREFLEETGLVVDGEFRELTAVKQKSGKTIYIWALQGNPDISTAFSNVFQLEWPPKSGKLIEVPEVDKVEWFTLAIAKKKIFANQLAFITELEEQMKL